MESINQTNQIVQPISTVIHSLTFPQTVLVETEEQKKYRLEKLAKSLKEREEWELRQKKFLQNQMLSKSGVPKIYLTKTAADFTITEQNNQALYALNNPNYSYYIYGECGTGKTFLASLITKEVINQNDIQPYFFTTNELIFLLNPYKPPEKSADQPILTRHQIYNSSMLVIDDLGVEKPSPLNNSIMFDLVNYRYNENLQTIFTSNFDIKTLQKRLGSYEGSRLGRRIVSMCKPIFLKLLS